MLEISRVESTFEVIKKNCEIAISYCNPAHIIVIKSREYTSLDLPLETFAIFKISRIKLRNLLP